MPRLSFEVTIPADATRQEVVIVGTDPALGSWQPEKGLALERQPDGRFFGAADLPYGLVEFKVTRGSWATEETNRDGVVVLNYHYLIAHDLTVPITVEHWKDCAPIHPDLVYGKTIELELNAGQLDQARRICIWLPPGYMQSHDSKHPVLYLLDGQDSLAVFQAPKNETLATDAWVRTLSGEGLIPELILVSIFHREEFGQRDIELSPQCDGPRMADFIVHDVKPFIDYTVCRDRVLADPANTGILGFSLGASLALFMSMRHAHVFGKFACLSVDFEDLSGDTIDDCELLDQLAADPGYRADRKLYFDHGEFGEDRLAAPFLKKLSAVLASKGLVENRDFKVLRAEGAEHSLTAWRARLGAPLRFLFGKT